MSAVFVQSEPVLEEILEARVYDVAIVGAGPAGASAALYAARGRLSTLVLDKAPGSGALAITHQIANYPGVEETLTGEELVERMRRHASSFGARFVQTSVQGVSLEGEEKELYTNDGIVRARSVIIAVGARGRATKLPGEAELLGRGVSYCATCDAAFHQGRVAAVVGDNEEAVHEARVLAQFASRVHLLVPGQTVWGMDSGEFPDLPNLTVHLQTRTLGVEGNPWVTGVRIQPRGGGDEVLPVQGVFIYLSGSKPATDFLMGQVPTDEGGYVQADETMATPVPGVFAAGDARRTPVKQAVIAAADGALAAIAAEKFVHGRKRLVDQR
ncbi:MAG: NAD(P)/FAD-dependent oxidoreductase [Bacillota bacterium]